MCASVEPDEREETLKSLVVRVFRAPGEFRRRVGERRATPTVKRRREVID